MSRKAKLAEVRFGTSGWRGILGEDFHFAGARAVALALVEQLDARGLPGPVVVAHDTRFLGAEIAGQCAGVLAGGGRTVLRGDGPVPTPVACHAVRTRRAAAGLIVTASHNPPAYQGLKVVAAGGGSAPLEMTRDLERRVASILLRRAPSAADARPPSRRPLGFTAAYLRDLRRRIDVDAISAARPHLVYDALHGVGSGPMQSLAAALGIPFTLLRGDPDPGFGGSAPDPSEVRLGDLAGRTRRTRGLRLGLATDGDADRFAALDASGAMLPESDAVALLVDHLARQGRLRRGVAISVATGSLVERVARAHGLAVERLPIGFKYLTEALDSGRADVAGEESGGFTWGAVSRDKDGLLAGTLLIEQVALSGRTLGHTLRDLHRAHGASASGRVAVARPAGARSLGPGLRALRSRLGKRLDGARVVGVDAVDGLRISLADGFVMLRASGTEPVARVYAEAPDRERLARRLRAGRRLLAQAESS
ncbi:MAG: hypothetical protein QNK05_06860 [Myxococcota bacterium]|nr:hypothetical protein [Myxococcota bacterium]